MGLDLGGTLALMGTVFVGNPLSTNPGFSIGGPTSSVENILDNALGLLGKTNALDQVKPQLELLTGTPRGLIGSHNFIESDSSNTRNDLYVTGDCATLDLDLFAEWFNVSSDPIGDFNMEVMADRANLRFQQTKATNPYFYYGPYTGLVARNAGYIFAGRLFANYSQAHPTGLLSMY
jgi:Peroxidase, family 2